MNLRELLIEGESKEKNNEKNKEKERGASSIQEIRVFEIASERFDPSTQPCRENSERYSYANPSKTKGSFSNDK